MNSAGIVPSDSFYPHSNWTIEVYPAQIELEHCFHEIWGFMLGAATVTIAALSAGYWAAMTLTAAFGDPGTLRAVAYGGLLVVFGGVGYQYSLLLMRLLAVSRYRFRPGALDVEIRRPLRKTSQEIVWAEVQELRYVIRTQRLIPAVRSHRLILHWQSVDGRRQWIAFAGDSEKEAELLGPLVEAWCRTSIQREHIA